MSGLMHCGICCLLTSAWGVVQLVVMGGFFYFEAFTLLEDVEAEEYDDYDDFIRKTEHNYQSAAVNCWIAAGLYFLSFILSYMCILKARAKAKKEAEKLEDDEYACIPKKIVKKNPKKIK